MRDIRCIQSAATPLIVAPVCIWPCNMEQINMDVWYLSGCARARVCVCLRCIISGISLFYPLDTYIFDVYFFRAHRCTVRSYQVYLASCHHWKPFIQSRAQERCRQCWNARCASHTHTTHRTINTNQTLQSPKKVSKRIEKAYREKGTNLLGSCFYVNNLI